MIKTAKTCQMCFEIYQGIKSTLFCEDCRTLTCPCGKKFMVGGAAIVIKTRKHCSEECRDKFGNKHWKGKKFPEETKSKMSEAQKRMGKIPPSWLGKKRPVRSEEHMRKILESRVMPTGENHHNYKGGRPRCEMCNNQFARYDVVRKICRHCVAANRTETNKDMRRRDMSRKEYRQWRKVVLQRDNDTCQICGTEKTKPHVNHIKKYSDYPELRTEISNGIALCDMCHLKSVNYHELEWESYFNFNLATRGFLDDEFIGLQSKVNDILRGGVLL